jgi:hypothetical protein
MNRFHHALSQQPIKVSITFKIHIIPIVSHRKNSIPLSSPFILFFHQLYHEFIDCRPWLQRASFTFKKIFRLELYMTALDVTFVQRNDACHGQKVSNHVALNFQIQRTVSVHGRRHVDFNEPGLQVRVNQDIEAQNLKTGINVRHRFLKRGVQDTLATDDCFDNKLVNSFKKVLSLLLSNVIG